MVLFGTVVEYLEVQPHQEKQAGRLSALWFIARPASWQDSASRSTEEAISRLKLLLPWPAAALSHLTFPATMDGIPSNRESEQILILEVVPCWAFSHNKQKSD